MPSRAAIRIAVKLRYGLQLGSGQRNSNRLALGLEEYIGMRTEAERFRCDMARFTGASKPGTSRLYEFVVGAAKARIARACLSTPPMANRARSLMPAYFSPANSGWLPFHSEKCVCIPEPLSSKIGLGINVAVFPCRRATFLTMYLYHIIWSPILTSSWNFMSISHWPAVATSW